ncbi:MAG: hypothetical protein AAF491_06845 [Verrucomicrobiota bacterium]
MKGFRSILFLFLGALLGLPASVLGQDEEVAEEKEWLEYYYQDPTPDRFVAQMKDWAEDGTLENEKAKPALIAFLSRVLRQNRTELRDWYDQLSGLSPAQKQVLHTALLFSRVSEADELMTDLFGDQYRERKVDTEKILEMPLDREMTIDMLWGFFYATGSESALRRIVLCFRFEDAPSNPEGFSIPDGYLPYYKALPNFAFNSLLANAERHPVVRAALEGMLESDESLIEIEKRGVYDILSELDPESYPPVQEEKERA